MVQTAVDRWWPDLPLWRLWLAQLWQESRCDPLAVSPVGARGLAQFMPGTWSDQVRRLSLDPYADPHTAKHAIPAGAAYMASLRQTWRRGREPLERNVLAQASYNAGTGNILKAQKACGDARRWQEIAPCLDLVTGVKNAQETTTYVARIDRWWREMEKP